MKTIVAVFIAFLVFFGCSEDYSHLPQMSIDYTWLKDQSCFDERSPEIILTEVPENTKLLKVKMEDLDNNYNHGGGTFEYNGSNLIPVGAISGYRGPCPMSTMNPRYEIRIKAIDENGDVIAFGKKFKRYPPLPE